MNLENIENKLRGIKNFNGQENAFTQAGIAQINLVISKTTTNAANYAELFCAGASAANVLVSDYGSYTAAYTFATGDLVLTFTTGVVTISCTDRPYRHLMEFMRTNSFKSSLIRMTVSDTSQFAQSIKTFKRSAFGADASNTINPEAYKDPQNQQNNIVDIDSQVTIDNEHGISMKLAAVDGLRVSLALFIPIYSKPNTAESQLG